MLPFIPKNIQIEISSRCTLHCPLCPKGRNEIKRERQDIDVRLFRDIIQEIGEHDPRVQLWNYGEPLLHENILEILEAIGTDFSDCSMSTNGHIMTDKLARRIVNSGLTEIIFSIDGIDQHTYERYRKGGSLNMVLHNLGRVIAAKGESKSDIKVTAQHIIFKHNFKDVPFLGDFFYPRGVEDIKVKSAMMMLEGEEREIVRVAREYLHLDYPGERYEIVDGRLSMKGEPMDRCPLIESSLVVTTDGMLLPCCWDCKAQYPVDSWERLREVEEVVNSPNPPEMCMRCPVRYQQVLSWEWNKVPGVGYDNTTR